MENDQTPELGEQILIQVGDVYLNYFGGKYVIVDTGDEVHTNERSGFQACKMYEKKGNEALGLPGTQFRSDIKQIIERLSVDEIISGLHIGLGRPSETLFNYIREAAKNQESRWLR